MTNRSAIVTLNSKKDLNEFNRKYAEHMLYNFPKFGVFPHVESNIPKVDNNFNQFNPLTMQIPNQSFINQFQNLNLYSKIYLIIIRPY